MVQPGGPLLTTVVSYVSRKKETSFPLSTRMPATDRHALPLFPPVPGATRWSTGWMGLSPPARSRILAGCEASLCGGSGHVTALAGERPSKGWAGLGCRV